MEIGRATLSCRYRPAEAEVPRAGPMIASIGSMTRHLYQVLTRLESPVDTSGFQLITAAVTMMADAEKDCGACVIRDLFRLFSWILAVLLCLTLLAWGGSRIVTDQLPLLQYFYWIPSLAYGLAAALLLSFSWLVAQAAQPHLPASFAPEGSEQFKMMSVPRAARWPRRAGAAAFAVLSAHAVLVEHHSLRGMNAPDSTPQSVRLVFWNAATDFMDDYASRITYLKPTMIGIANPAAYAKWDELRAEVGPDSDAQRFGRLAFISPYRILAWGGTKLGVSGADTRYFDGKPSVDQGEAMFVELDAEADFGRPIVVWLVDLPSDLHLPRQRVTREAMATMLSFSGPTYIRGTSGVDEQVPGRPQGFPSPDIIMGDFNIPRGSDSIRTITRDLRDSYEVAGWGLKPTWHRQYPMVAIDHVYISEVMRALRYDAINVGAGKHMLLVVDLKAAG